MKYTVKGKGLIQDYSSGKPGPSDINEIAAKLTEEMSTWILLGEEWI